MSKFRKYLFDLGSTDMENHWGKWFIRLEKGSMLSWVKQKIFLGFIL